MQTGDEIILKIEDITHLGWGVGREHEGDSGGAVVFVPHTAPDEIVKARITEARKNFYVGDPEEIIELSVYRVEPQCPYFGVCPGCTLQHLSYEGQADARFRRVERIFRKVISDMYPEPEMILSPQALGYRTHVSVKVERQGKSIAIGYTDPATKRVVDIEKCLLMPEFAHKPYLDLREKIHAHAGDIPGSFSIRLFFDHEEMETYAVAPRGALKKYRSVPKIIDRILAGFPKPHALKRRIDGVLMKVHPAVFVQANYFLTKPLYESALRRIKPKNDDTVLELYSGSGYFTLALAESVKTVIALESDRRACDNLSLSAKELMKSSRDKKKKEPVVVIVQGKAEAVTKEVLDEYKPNIVIANPPRSGIHKEVIEALCGCDSVRQVVIISCDISTCTRDMKLMMDAGFKPGDASILDCYPQTAHVETVASLTR